MHSLNWAKNNEHFAYGLGTGLGYRFNYLNKSSQKDILKQLGKNSELAQGFGLGLGVIFEYLPEKSQEKISKL